MHEKPETTPGNDSFAFLAGGGEMGGLIRSHDWASTSIGPPDRWPQALRTVVSIMLGSSQPMFTAWGPDKVLLYNDGYAQILQSKHPQALGRPFLTVWHEIRDALTPIVENAYAGESIHMDDIELEMQRKGFTEETHFAFSYTPIRDDSGSTRGFFCPCDEVTSLVVSTRRNAVLRNLAENLTGANSIEEVLARAEATLSRNTRDLPCTLFYRIERHGGIARLVNSTGLAPGPNTFLEEIDTGRPDADSRFWKMVIQTRRPARIDDFISRFGLLQCGPYPEAPRTAIALPLAVPGRQKSAAVLIAGASPRLSLDEGYRNFFELVANTISAALTNAMAFEQEKKRAESLVKAEAEIRASEKKFRSVFEQAAIGIGRVSFSDARWIEVNDTFCHMIGYSREELSRIPWPRITHPEDLDSDLIPFRRMAAGELESYTVEKRFIHKQGHHVWARLTLSLVRDDRGRPDYEIAVIENISERKKAEEALQQSEERFRTLFENMTEGFALGELLKDENDTPYDFRFIEANKAFERQSGLTLETLGSPLTEVLPQLEPHWLETYGRVALTGKSVRFENYNQDLDKYFDVYCYSPGKGRFAIIFRDITKRKRDTEELRLREEKFRTAFHANPSLMVISSMEEDRFIEVNKAFEEVMGFSREEMIGRTSSELGIWHDLEQRRQLTERINEQGHLRDVEVALRTKAGELRTFMFSAESITIEGVPCFMSAWLDITDRKRAEENIKRSHRELEQFSYAVSHDLQEPLRSIIGFLQLLQQHLGEKIDAKGQRYIERAVAAGNRMQALIRDLLSLSRVTTSNVAFLPTDLNSLVQSVLASLEPSLKAKDVSVRCSELPSLPVDASQIQSLFQNLIVNAVKYNRSPRPTVDIGYRANAGDRRFFVRDNGIGIAPQFHDRIFQVFQRLHTDREYPGTGVGLALCKRIVDRHDGTIWVESEPEKGSTFFFTLGETR